MKHILKVIKIAILLISTSFLYAEPTYRLRWILDKKLTVEQVVEQVGEQSKKYLVYKNRFWKTSFPETVAYLADTWQSYARWKAGYTTDSAKIRASLLHTRPTAAGWAVLGVLTAAVGVGGYKAGKKLQTLRNQRVVNRQKTI